MAAPWFSMTGAALTINSSRLFQPCFNWVSRTCFAEILNLLTSARLSPNEGLVAYGASHGRSRVHRREVGHQLARRRDAALDECRGEKPAAARLHRPQSRNERFGLRKSATSSSKSMRRSGFGGGDASRSKGVTSNARTLTERDVSHGGVDPWRVNGWP